jgi:hypothetical protein
MAGVERGDVGFGQHRGLGELGVQPVDQRLAVAVEHPQGKAQRPHVLAAQRFLVAKAERLDRFERQRRNVERQKLPLFEAAVLERVLVVLRLFKVALVELAGVRDDQAAGLQLADVGLQRGRVHRHQHVGRVARGFDLGRSEIDLERGNAEQRALRRADFGRKVRERRQIVARQRGRQRELTAGKLHPVAGIAREAHDDRFGCGGRGPASQGVRTFCKCCNHSLPRLRNRALAARSAYVSINPHAKKKISSTRNAGTSLIPIGDASQVAKADLGMMAKNDSRSQMDRERHPPHRQPEEEPAAMSDSETIDRPQHFVRPDVKGSSITSTAPVPRR